MMVTRMAFAGLMSAAALLAAAMLVALVAAPAGGATAATCDRRPAVLRQLEGKYAEKPVAIGVANNGGVVEVLTTKDGATWTIVITLPNGMTCLVAAGEDWESIPNVKFGPPA